MAPSTGQKPSKEQETRSLLDLCRTTVALLNQYSATLSSPSSTTNTSSIPEDAPPPLSVLADAAALLKAQTTKLTLLLINEPLTPSAISSVLKTINATCLPALMSGAQLCAPETYGRMLEQEVRHKVGRVMKAFGELMTEAEEVVEAGKLGRGKKEEGLKATGLVWEGCDKLGELKGLGLAGVVQRRVEEWRDLVRDAIEELREWGEEGEEDEDDEDGAAGSDAENKAVDDFEDIFGAQNKCPGQGELRELLERTLKKLKLVHTLFQALLKRRIKPFPIPPSPNLSSPNVDTARNIKALDSLAETLKNIPTTVDNLASAFYDLDGSAGRSLLADACMQARRAGESVARPWNGGPDDGQDEFGVWVVKWSDALSAGEP